jgi:hypothetical protein
VEVRKWLCYFSSPPPKGALSRFLDKPDQLDERNKSPILVYVVKYEYQYSIRRLQLLIAEMKSVRSEDIQDE